MAAANMEVFDAYFRRADLDGDGRISGAEAVAFFQGANLPTQILAQIWAHADQNRTGFLGRPEFYNALKLITVAQSRRELTPDIVKAALYGPAAARIPAPQINLVSTSAPQMNSAAVAATQSRPLLSPSAQMGGSVGPTVAQHSGIRGPQSLSGAGTSQQFFPSAGNHSMRPHQNTPTVASVQAQGAGQGVVGGGSIAGPQLPGSNAPNLSTDWLGNRNTGMSAGGASQVPLRGPTPSMSQDGFVPAVSGAGVGAAPKSQMSTMLASSFPSKPIDSGLPSIQPAAKDSKALVASGNGFSSDSVFGGDVFSATPQAKQDTSVLQSVSASIAGTSQNSHKTGQLDLPGKPPLPPSGSHWQQAQSLVKQNQPDKIHSASALTVSNVLAGPVNSSPSESQLPWPKFTQSNIQKYAAVFVKVDKDRDGKITGEEARNLFLSWRLPREVLKQVWDLSDQDNDSMLSLREFCTALYLMERYREGRPLPAVLPNSIKFDEILLLATNQRQMPAYGGSAWQASPGLSQQGIPASHPAMPATGMKPPMQTPLPSQTDGAEILMQQKSKVPILEKQLVDQLSKEEQSALNTKFQEAAEADKRVQELEKEILESKEKTEFYRHKMQELVLYKSRCDSRLNEITERVSADKHEIELLVKKYEVKCKQIGGDLASKLTLEEATFRDIQAKKLELYNAIVKMEQGGSSDDILKDRADRIHSDLEELVRALNERCKQYGLHAKPTSLIELPFGWQPGIQEGAADWSEDWDKFDDEGFAVVKELTFEVENIVATSKPKSPGVESDKNSNNEVPPVALSSSNGNKTEKPSSNGEHVPGIESVNANSDDESARSPPGSPERSAATNQSHDLNTSQFEMHDGSPRDKETHSEHGGAESSISGDKVADDPSWGATFDASDDADSVWGFSAIKTKEIDYEKSRQSSFFDSGDFGLNPIRTDSPSAASVFGKEKSPFFDSVPSTPMFYSGTSPKFNEGQGDHSFNSFGRFDSFSTHDSGFFPQHEGLARFDSFRSTADHGQGDSFARFDSIRSTADRGQAESFARFDSFRSTTDHSWGESFVRFDSIQSSADHSRGFPSFDDADPFGSTGPFKSSESHSPRRGTDNWSAF